MSNRNENKAFDAHADQFPEHGPFDENGREILISVENVDINFGKGDNVVRAVKNASFNIYRGETFSLVGESGSGKTTIGRAIVRANNCSAGEIRYKGVRISGKISRALDREVVRNLQMVFQDPAASLNERATVEYIVSEGLYNFHLYKDEADRIRKVEKIIEDVGLLPEHLTRYPHEFSGGQRQRVGLARSMVMEPEFVVADEPISALDVSIRAQILNLMNKFKEELGTTFMFIAHDLSIVRYISDRIGVIYKGRIVEVASAEELFSFPLHPYTRSLISAIPLPDPKLEKQKILCTFEPKEYGENETPELKLIGHDHYVFGTDEEVEAYRILREKNIPMKSIIIDEGTGDQPIREIEETPGGTLIRRRACGEVLEHEEILDRPLHDNGGFLLGLLSFLLPVLGLPAAYIFRKKNYIKNYKQCKKSAIAGFICLGVIILIFGLLILKTIS